MKNRKTLKIIATIVVFGIVTAVIAALYMFNMPHRDIQSVTADFSLTSTEIVNEYLNDKNAANQKYLASDGESKILEITGVINNISEDFNGQKVVLLKNKGNKAGVSITLTATQNEVAYGLQIGETIIIKGVIRAGAAYDEDLEMYENVILEKGNIISK